MTRVKTLAVVLGMGVWDVGKGVVLSVVPLWGTGTAS